MINKTKRAYLHLLKKKRKKGWVNPLLHELEEGEPKKKPKKKDKKKQRSELPE